MGAIITSKCFTHRYMSQNHFEISKLLSYLPPVVLAVSVITTYSILLYRVEAIEKRQISYDPTELRVRLGYIEASVNEIKQDVKELRKK